MVDHVASASTRALLHFACSPGLSRPRERTKEGTSGGRGLKEQGGQGPVNPGRRLRLLTRCDFGPFRKRRTLFLRCAKRWKTEERDWDTQIPWRLKSGSMGTDRFSSLSSSVLGQDRVGSTEGGFRSTTGKGPVNVDCHLPSSTVVPFTLSKGRQCSPTSRPRVHWTRSEWDRSCRQCSVCTGVSATSHWSHLSLYGIHTLCVSQNFILFLVFCRARKNVTNMQLYDYKI